MSVALQIKLQGKETEVIESVRESGAVLRVVRWRGRVLAEFNRLLRSSKPASHMSPKSRLQRSPRPR